MNLDMMQHRILALLLLSCFWIIDYGYAATCAAVTMSNGIACECTATFCDTIDIPPTVTQDNVVVYTTNQAGKRLEMTVLSVPTSPVTAPTTSIPVKLDGVHYQQMLGFGGAFTDAAAYVVGKLPTAVQNFFYDTYFSRQGGAKYSMGRVPVGGSDFSRSSYSLVQTANDLTLSDFALRDDNLVSGQDAKLAMIQKAQQVIASTTTSSDPASLKLLQTFASIWSVPVWMKTCSVPPSADGINACGSGFYPWLYGRPKSPTYLFGGLKSTSNIRSAYAQYWVKFFQAYKNAGVALWGLTAQNEPSGNPIGNKWDNTYYSPADLASMVNTYLGPAIKSVFPNVKIMVGDDQYPTISDHAAQAATSNFIDGVGYHWYYSFSGSILYSETMIGLLGGQIKVSQAAQKYAMNNRNGNKFLLMTEACTGFNNNDVQPGSWERGYNYMTDILHEVESGSAGWVDWNLALDMTGGPNWAGNKVDSPILVDSNAGIFYKNPMYYSLAHFSAFVPPGAIRIGVSNANQGYIGSTGALEVVAFRTSSTSDDCVLIIVNDHLTASIPARGLSSAHTISFTLPTGRNIIVEIAEHEFKTILFKCPGLDIAKSAVFTLEEATATAPTFEVGISSGIIVGLVLAFLGAVVVSKMRKKSSVSDAITSSSILVDLESAKESNNPGFGVDDTKENSPETEDAKTAV